MSRPTSIRSFEAFLVSQDDKFFDTMLDVVGYHRLVLYLSVLCLAGIREMFVDGFIIFDIYVALFIVRFFLGQTEKFAM